MKLNSYFLLLISIVGFLLYFVVLLMNWQGLKEVLFKLFGV